MDIPQDPFMLLSYINMQLRDNYESLDELCGAIGVDKQQLISKLSAAGFEYMESIKQFR